MRIFIASLAIASFSLISQENAPIGILRGQVVSWSGDSRGGSIVVRTPADRLLECSYDDKTWFEHQNQHIAVAAIKPGDHLEIVADHKLSSNTCYARTVQVVDAVAPRRTPSGKPRLSSPTSITEFLAPRGDMTFSGMVAKLSGDWMTLRTRNQGAKTLLLRSDTRFLGNGLAQDRSSLPAQKLVFVRAGRNIDGDIEVYTIIWGDLLIVDR